MKGRISKMVPYLNFEGNCEDAMNFYKDVFDGTIALSLDATDSETGTEIFNRLSAGGQVGVPFQKQFWGAWHGNLVDKYGIRWMINLEELPQP